jgi:CRISPR type III-B/RAMP module RAMP protein Cmr6
MNGGGRGPDRRGPRGGEPRSRGPGGQELRPPARQGSGPRGPARPPRSVLESDPPASGHRALRSAVAEALLRPGVMEALSPGFYYQRCLKLWTARRDRTVKEKRDAVSPLLAAQAYGARIVRGEPDLHRALLRRQAETVDALCRAFAGLKKRLRNITPFVTGIGQPHPLETGFAFLKPYGIPYLAGSGVKGAVRTACADDWLDRFGEAGQRERLLHYYGSADKEEPARRQTGSDHHRGALVFLDMFPAPPPDGRNGWADALQLDIVNPHYGKYYQGQSVPADWLSPVPSYFLTLAAGLEWSLYIIYAPLRDPRADWEKEIEPGLVAALTANGLGAKKTLGYGLFEVLSRVDGAGPPEMAEASSPAPVGARTAAAARGPSAAAQALEARMRSLRSHEIKPQAEALRRDLERCREDERGPLLGALEARLKELGWRRRDVDAMMDRLRGSSRAGDAS